MWNQKYYLIYTKVIGFVAFRVTSKVLGIISADRSWVDACRVTSKFIGIGSVERSWGDVKKTKSGKISSIGSGISEKQSIVYTSACIE